VQQYSRLKYNEKELNLKNVVTRNLEKGHKAKLVYKICLEIAECFTMN